MSLPTRKNPGFTLVELMVAMVIFLVMLGFFGRILSSVYDTWDASKREADVSQNARAILNLIERDLSTAVVSGVLQFGQNPVLDPAQMPLDPSNFPERQITDSMFWWMPTTQTESNGICPVGWYLSEGMDARNRKICQLRRYSAPAFRYNAVGNEVGKIYWLQSSLDKPVSIAPDSRVLCESVLGFWVECLDRSGSVIPGHSSIAPLQYNSAASFQMSAPGLHLAPQSLTFQYTDPATTNRADLLPAAVRVTLLVTDEATLGRHPLSNSPPSRGAGITYAETQTEVARLAADYRKTLADQGIWSKLFSTTVKLANAQKL